MNNNQKNFFYGLAGGLVVVMLAAIFSMASFGIPDDQLGFLGWMLGKGAENTNTDQACSVRQLNMARTVARDIEKDAKLLKCDKITSSSLKPVCDGLKAVKNSIDKLFTSCNANGGAIRQNAFRGFNKEDKENQDRDNKKASSSFREQMNQNQPVIKMLDPQSGIVGAKVVILGANFTKDDNIIHFGSGYISQKYSSTDSKTITFIVPTTISGCVPLNSTATKCQAPDFKVVPGDYRIQVLNSNGVSNIYFFSVTEK